MPDQDSEINNQSKNPESINKTRIETKSDLELIDQSQSLDAYPKWINNKGEEVKQVFGFNENAELVNARVAMIGFLMLILTELAFAGEPATLKIFGISQNKNNYLNIDFINLLNHLKAMNKNTVVGISYVSAWIIIWGTIGSLIDFYFLQNTYLPGSLGHFSTFIITALISSIVAIYLFPKINNKFIS